MSGSQACRDSPQGPIEKEMCHLKAEKNKGDLCLRLGYSLIDKYVAFIDKNA